jgi:hypothetical protein
MSVAQLLDIGDVRQSLGSLPFTLAQLASWTEDEPLTPRMQKLHPVTSAPSNNRRPTRTEAEYRALADAILTSEEWRNMRGRDPAARQRKLRFLMNQALDQAPPIGAITSA